MPSRLNRKSGSRPKRALQPKHGPKKSQSVDEKWMANALRFAEHSDLRATAPNPQVACIIVQNDRLIAHAVHERFGGLHAEALALKAAGPRARGATAYLTLEPCSHTDKKTPPCVNALIAAGIRRVVIACRDENPAVSGRGVHRLKKNGIAVREGVGKNRALELYRFFFHWIKTKKPWVTLKMAGSIDGKITSSRRWLSNPLALHDVQRIRAQQDAILVGKNTVQTDNPRLTVRDRNGKDRLDQPLRVILDSQLQLSTRLRVFRNGPVLLACTPNAPEAKKRKRHDAGIATWTSSRTKNGQVPLGELLAELGRRGIRSVLVEGGAQVATEFLTQGKVDEAYFYVAPVLSGFEAVPLYGGPEIRPTRVRVRLLGDDACFHMDFLGKKKRLLAMRR